MNDGARARAFVIGGGVAGIAAAIGLGRRGRAVTLLEAHAWLGGRAFSSVDRHWQRPLDNGPHVVLGCYRALRALLRELGTEDGLAAAATLSIAYRTSAGGQARLRLGRVPVPLAMPAALLGLPLRMRERLAVLRGLCGLLPGTPADWTLADWIARRGQAGAPAAYLWLPMCRAIMNAEPDRVSARLFASTLRQAFGGSAANAALWVPRRPWSELLGAAAARVLPQRGIDVRTHAGVVAFDCRQGAVVRLLLADGSRLDLQAGDVVVSAVPWHRLAALLGGVHAFAGLVWSPIVTVYFEFERDDAAPPDEGPMTVLVGGQPFHFLYRTPGAPRRQFALLGGGGAFDGAATATLAASAREQLVRHYPGLDARAPAQTRIRKEAQATFVAGPGTGPQRPAAGRLPGGPANLWLCGDWTATALPSTLEGAARSAGVMLAAMDRP